MMTTQQQIVYDKVKQVIDEKKRKRIVPEHCLMTEIPYLTLLDISCLRQLVKDKKLKYSRTINQICFFL